MSNLSYTIRKNDSSIKEIREKEEFYGMEQTNPRSFSDKYIDFSNEVLLNQNIIDNFVYERGTPNKDKIRSSGKIWSELGIKLQDVQFVKEENKDLEFEGRIDKRFCDALEISSPLNIPITFIDNYLDTYVLTLHISMKDCNSVVFRKVFLPKLEDKINSVIYSHELTHTELNDAGSGIKKYINKETIPIFIEQLFADKIDQRTLELCRNNRFATVAAGIEEMRTNKKLSFKSRIDLETYLISTIQATNLANIYFESNKKIKKEMIKYINKLFTGELKTEDMLEHFDSSFDEIEPSLKKLQKIKKR